MHATDIHLLICVCMHIHTHALVQAHTCTNFYRYACTNVIAYNYTHAYLDMPVMHSYMHTCALTELQ